MNDKHKSLLVAACAIIIIIGGYVLYRSGQMGEGPLSQFAAINPNLKNGKEADVNGVLQLRSSNGRRVFSNVETITLTLVGNSDGKPAVGYDAALVFNADVLTFSRAESLLDSFELFTNESEETVYVGGIKNLDAEAMVLTETPLANMSFRPAGAGHTVVKLNFEPDQTNESNIVLGDAKDILIDAEGIDIYVGGLKTLPLGSYSALPNSEIQIGLESVTEAGTGQVIVSDGNTQETLPASGFHTAFGYVFEFGELTRTSAQVYFAPANEVAN